MTTREAFMIVEDELRKAKEKHPAWPADIADHGLIIAEESSELMQSILKWKYEDGSIEAMKEESAQTAAMCIRFLENLDETTATKPPRQRPNDGGGYPRPKYGPDNPPPTFFEEDGNKRTIW